MQSSEWLGQDKVTYIANKIKTIYFLQLGRHLGQDDARQKQTIKQTKKKNQNPLHVVRQKGSAM